MRSTLIASSWQWRLRRMGPTKGSVRLVQLTQRPGADRVRAWSFASVCRVLFCADTRTSCQWASTWPRLTLLVNARQSISNAMGMRFTSGMDLVSLVLQRRM